MSYLPTNRSLAATPSSPHVDLLLSCAGARPPHTIAAAPDTDWPRFLALVERHGLGPHVHAVLCAEGLPDEVRTALASLDAGASSHSMLLAARLVQLLPAFDRAGVPVIALKGPALAQQLYGDAAMRDSVDLDLLVPADRVPEAVAVLEAGGYALDSALDWLGLRHIVAAGTEATFRHPSGTSIDLHWAANSQDVPGGIPAHRLWQSSTTVNIASRPVRVLGPECLLVYLCMHGAHHCWSCLRWLSDVAMLLGGEERIDWPTVTAIAEESRAVRPVALGLLLAQKLLAAAVPGGVFADARAQRAVRRAADEVMRRLSTSEPSSAPRSLQKTWFTARLWAGEGVTLQLLGTHLRAPTEADAASLRLPRQLVLLYYPWRLLRLATKYSRALVTG